MNLLELLSVVFGAGGLATFVGTYIIFYKAKKRKSSAEADAVEIKNEQTEVDRLEARLKLRDEKVDSMYLELRAEQNARHKAELELEILKIKRCDVRGCPDRIPSSDY